MILLLSEPAQISVHFLFFTWLDHDFSFVIGKVCSNLTERDKADAHNAIDVTKTILATVSTLTGIIYRTDDGSK